MGTIGHAALYVGDGNIIHAIQKGVSESNLEKWQKDKEQRRNWRLETHIWKGFKIDLWVNVIRMPFYQ
mgnify:CR=1 FL=1